MYKNKDMKYMLTKPKRDTDMWFGAILASFCLLLLQIFVYN